MGKHGAVPVALLVTLLGSRSPASAQQTPPPPPAFAAPATPPRPIFDRPLEMPAPPPQATQPVNPASSPLALGASEDESFVEGELASVGAIGFVPWENRAGIVIGLERLGEVFFLGLKPEVNHTRYLLDRKFSMTFGVPLRLEMLDGTAEDKWGNAGRPRAQDWNEARDFVQIIQNITWGGKEKHFYLDINQFRAATLGHGAIVRRYNQNLDFNVRRVSLEFDAFTDYGGGEVFLDDIAGPHVVGGLLFMKPLSLVDRRNSMMRSASIGVSFMADVDAPLRNRLDFDDVDDDGRRAGEMLVEQESFQPQYVSMPVLAYGVDAEVKLYDDHGVDWKTYADYSFLQSGLPTDDPADLRFSDIPTKLVRSGGFTWGNLVRVNLGPNGLHALRFRLEYRAYQPNYLPGYFDVTYQIDRVQYAGKRSRDPVAIANRTKLQQVLGRDPDGPWVHGGYFEASWRMSHWVALALGVEFNSETPDNSMFVHAEVPLLKGWQFMATYHRRNASGVADLFKWFTEGNDLFIARTRYAIWKPFAVAVEAVTPFGFHTDFLRRELEVNALIEFGWPYLKEVPR